MKFPYYIIIMLYLASGLIGTDRTDRTDAEFPIPRRPQAITVFFRQVGHVTISREKKMSQVTQSVSHNSTTSQRIVPEIILHDAENRTACHYQ